MKLVEHFNEKNNWFNVFLEVKPGVLVDTTIGYSSETKNQIPFESLSKLVKNDIIEWISMNLEFNPRAKLDPSN